MNSEARRIHRPAAVRSLLDMRDRCVVDEETDCWHWRGALAAAKARGARLTGRVYIAPGVLGNERATIMSCQKATWLFAGNALKPGHLVWRHTCNTNDCISPHHGKSGTNRQMHDSFIASGRYRGDPARILHLSKIRAPMLLPVAVVRAAEAMFEDGRMTKEVRAELGLSAHSAARIRRGTHPNSSNGVPVLSGASVFAWRGAS